MTIKDIVPELLSTLQADFYDKINNNKDIAKLGVILDKGKATYAEANALACEVGIALAKSYELNITSEVLPDGKMHYNVANRIVAPTLAGNHAIVASYCADVQTALNRRSNIRIRGIKPKLNTDRIDGIVDKLTVDDYDKVKWLLGEPVINFTQAVVDEAVRVNADFNYRAGLKARVERREAGNCCDWCRELVGTYEYPNIPKDVYRRHRFCRCTVEYFPGDGRKQDVKSKVWLEPDKRAKKEERKRMAKRPIMRGKHR